MEQTNKRFNLRNIFIFLFVVVNITDIITTMLAKSKHTMDYEVNPVFALTNSSWIMYTLKILGVIFLVWYMVRRYKVDKSPFYRYFMMYVIVLFFVFLVGATVNNYLYYLTPVGEVGPPPITTEQKLESMEYMISDLGIISDLGSESKRIKISPLLSVFLMNMFQFMVWQSFEIHSWKK